MKIISFCLFFNPGATTLIVHIESNSHITQEILSGLGRGSFKQLCKKTPREEKRTNFKILRFK